MAVPGSTAVFSPYQSTQDGVPGTVEREIVLVTVAEIIAVPQACGCVIGFPRHALVTEAQRIPVT